MTYGILLIVHVLYMSAHSAAGNYCGLQINTGVLYMLIYVLLILWCFHFCIHDTLFLFMYALRMLHWMYIKFATKMKFQMEAVCLWSFGRLELVKFFASTHFRIVPVDFDLTESFRM
jgi:hypothetical protein